MPGRKFGGEKPGSLLLTEGTACMLITVTEWRYREPPARSRPRHARPPRPQDARPRADERLGDQPTPQADLGGSPAGERRLTLPRAPQARAGGLDQRRVAAVG